MFEIMDKIWRCGRVEFEGTENLEAGDGFLAMSLITT